MKLISKFLPAFIALLLFSGNLFSQRGKDGPGNITVANTVVNTVSDTLAVNVAAGATSITVGTGTGFAAGDLVFIIQMQGAKVNAGKDTIFPDTLNSIPSSLAYGNITNYYTTGNNEFFEITSVAGNVLTLDCGLKNSYSAFSQWHSRKFGNTQVIRVPRYTTLSVTGAGSITCNQWNGRTGGVVVVEVKYATTLNAATSIDVSGKGFRGGGIENSTTFGSGNYGSCRATEGGIKGEGIGGDTARYSKLFSGIYGRGSVANGGGAGDGNNAGGGGGANAGNTASFFEGQGNPVAGYTTAW
ncbi:MAG: hypothetical protein ACJ76F_01045, partial [Bacteroidia bacterium]